MDVVDLIKHLSKAVPDSFVQELLPWCLETVERHKKLDLEDAQYHYDALSYNWYSDVFRMQLAFVHGLIDALTSIATTDSSKWLEIADKLERSDFSTPHQLLTHVYRRTAEQYADQIFAYLFGDTRRLRIGYSAEYDSRELMKSVAPQLTSQQLLELEAQILAVRDERPSWVTPQIELLTYSGTKQYRLLHALFPEYLSSRGLKRYREWQRKFVGYEIEKEPTKSKGGVVGPPIDQDRVAKMSDRSWLHAFAKYRNGVQHTEFLSGGSGQLSSILQSEIEADPDRFYRLMLHIGNHLDDDYARAFINGFAASHATVSYCYEAIKLYGTDDEREDIKRPVCWAVKKIYKVGVPADIFDLLISWATDEIGKDEIRRENANNNHELRNDYINTNRGAALETVMRILHTRNDAESIATIWQLLEFAADDQSLLLKAGAIHELSFMVSKERQRAFGLFEKMLANEDIMFRSQDVREFIYWVLYKNFKQVHPYVEKMMHHSDEAVQQRGAEQACIASFSHLAIEDEEARVASGCM